MPTVSPWPQDWIPRLEACLGQDPAGRGLASYRDKQGASLVGQRLDEAARSLAEAREVVILTGFPVLTPDGIHAETDGPPGTVALARVLIAAGIRTHLVAEAFVLPVLTAACQAAGIDSVPLIPLPDSCSGGDRLAAAAQFDAWSARWSPAPSHLVAIERVGPSHTLDSLAAQPRVGPPPLNEFEQVVPARFRNVAQNMRGESIDPFLAPVERWWTGESPLPGKVTTIGVGDGGNELGMGSIPWETLARAIARGARGQVACRVAATHCLVAGVSNWGAHALALLVGVAHGVEASIRRWDAQQEERILQAIVAVGGVDGVTRRAEPTVDGLPRETYLEVVQAIADVADST